ncbi:MAG: site-2 protease family protein, partial [Terriglobia bacterium]
MGNGFQSLPPLPLAEQPGLPQARKRRFSFRVFFWRVLGSLPVCILLFLLTILTTLIVGVHLEQNYAARLPIFDLDISWSFFAQFLSHPARLWAGAPYAFTTVGILLAHEMGHYLTCRHYRLEATYPFFIPAPTVVGTWGAFIQIRSPLVTRQELFDVGISGPIAGFVVAIPMLVISAWNAGSRATAFPSDSLIPGHPLALTLLVKGFHPGIQISRLALTPMGCGVWVGLFVTALNLIPIGQLDGGHIFYAVFGHAHRYVSIGFFIALIPLGYFWHGWWVWAVLMIVIGLRHPPPLMDSEPLD